MGSKSSSFDGVEDGFGVDFVVCTPAANDSELFFSSGLSGVLAVVDLGRLTWTWLSTNSSAGVFNCTTAGSMDFCECFFVRLKRSMGTLGMVTKMTVLDRQVQI